MLPVETGAAGFLRCRSERTPEGACVTVCGVGFSALPFCAGSGRCEARCSAERAASGRVVECGDAPASRLGNGAAGDIGFSAPPFCAGIGRCEARCSAGRAASGRVVERGGIPTSRLEDGAAGAGCSRVVERPSMRVPLVGCAASGSRGRSSTASVRSSPTLRRCFRALQRSRVKKSGQNHPARNGGDGACWSCSFRALSNGSMA